MAFQFLCPQGHLLQSDPAHMGRAIKCPTCGILFVIPTANLGPTPAPVVVPTVPVPGGAPTVPVVPTGRNPAGTQSSIGSPVKPIGEPEPPPNEFPEPLDDIQSLRKQHRRRGGRRVDFDLSDLDSADDSAADRGANKLPLGEGPPREVDDFPFPTKARSRGLPDLEPGDESDSELPELGVKSRHGSTGPATFTPRTIHIHCPQGHELVTTEDMLEEEAICPHCGAQFVMQYRQSVEYQREQLIKQETQERKLGNHWLFLSIFIGSVVLIMLGVMIYFATRR